MTDLLAGRYELRARISRGGMGAVWRAYDRRLRREVAVKVLHTWIAEDEDLARRFDREARLLAPLENEHIVRLYDYGDNDETPFLVMELIEGASLAEVARGRTLSWDQAVEVAVPVATALAYAHERGIVHRDLTPGNILVEKSTGRIVVSDFGLARLAQSSSSVTTQGMLLGTPEYWSPEQARGRDSGTASDMYAFGCLLFWLLSGKTPFDGEDRLAVGLRRVHEAAPTLSSRVADAPPEAARLVDALLASEPSARPTAVDVLGTLGAASPEIAATVGRTLEAAGQLTGVFAAALPTIANADPVRHSARRRRRGRRMTVVALGIVAAGALAFVGATIANADRIVDVPEVSGMTVAQARTALASAAHLDAADAPVTVGGRPYSESVATGRVLSQTPAAGSRVERAGLDLIVRVSRGTAYAIMPDVRGVSRKEGVETLRAAGFGVRTELAESWDSPEGTVLSTDVDPGDSTRRPGPITLVVSSGPPRSPVPDVRGMSGDDVAARLDGTFATDIVEEGSDSVAAGTVLRQSPDPGTQAVFGSTVTVTVARAPEWMTSWSKSGSGDYDSGALDVSVPQRKWRIVLELHPRYLIFGSGSATLIWEGTGSGQIGLDAVGSTDVQPRSGAGSYRLRVQPRGSVNWSIRIEQLG